MKDAAPTHIKCWLVFAADLHSQSTRRMRQDTPLHDKVNQQMPRPPEHIVKSLKTQADDLKHKGKCPGK